MKATCLFISLGSIFFIIGCMPVQVQEPKPYISLYQLNDGKIIIAAIYRSSLHQGKLVSPKNEDESFEGEYYLYENDYVRYPYPRPIYHLNKTGDSVNQSPEGQQQTVADEDEHGPSFPERFGFGKLTDAKPAGTAVLVGSKGTVIEIVFYHVSGNFREGDGIARDNNGKYYRIFLGEE